jgi:hypothetical protein
MINPFSSPNPVADMARIIMEMPEMIHKSKAEWNDEVQMFFDAFNISNPIPGYHFNGFYAYSADANGVTLFASFDGNYQRILWKRDDVSRVELLKFFESNIHHLGHILSDNKQTFGARKLYVDMIKSLNNLTFHAINLKSGEKVELTPYNIHDFEHVVWSDHNIVIKVEKK